MIITKTINSDLLIKGPAQEIYAVQGDCYTRKVTLRLLSNKEPWTPDSPIAVSIRYCKPDGTGGIYDTLPNGEKAWEQDKNLLSFLLAPQMLTVPGRVSVQVEMSNAELVLATFPLELIVTEDPSAKAIQSEDYFNLENRLEDKLRTTLAQIQESGDFKGDTGVTPQLQIGTVSTLASDEPASAVIRGTAESPILDLGIPKGTDAAVDNTLRLPGQAADAQAVGNALTQKAPAGFGLGDASMGNDIWGIENLDYAIKNGWYCLVCSGENIDQFYFNSAIVRVSNLSLTSAVVQEIYPVETACFIRRYRDTSGNWLPFEWVNPPMVLGKEYRTVERWNGKPVYTFCVNAGVIPNGSAAEITPTDTSGRPLLKNATDVIEAKAILRYNNGTYEMRHDGAKTWVDVDLFTGSAWVNNLFTHSEATSANVRFKYTKE